MLTALLFITLIAVGGVVILFGWGDRRHNQPHWCVAGYPAARFPARTLVQDGPLASLTAIQSRLLRMQQQLPPGTDTAVWLQVFLGELRAIMDTAYTVMLATNGYERSPIFDWLVVELQQIEREIAFYIAQDLLLGDADPHHELFAGRLASLRMCASELGSLQPEWGIGSRGLGSRGLGT